MPHARYAFVLAAVAALACSKAPRRRMSHTVRNGQPVLEVYCEPGDRIRIVRPAPSDERRCDGKEVAGAEVFPLHPGDFTLGHNSWTASVVQPRGGTLQLTEEFEYAPKAEELGRLFALAEPSGGADAVSAPPEVSAAFLPGAPHTAAGVVEGDLVFLLKAPMQTRFEAGGKTFTVENPKGVEVHVPLTPLLADAALKDACGPLEVPAKLTRSDGVAHEGKLVVTHAAPRVLRPLSDEKPVMPAGAIKTRTVFLVRDDSECWSIGDAKVKSVGVIVLIDQLRRDLEACKKGKGKSAEETPRFAMDVALGAFDPRTGKRHGEKTFLAPNPPCSAKSAPRALISTVDPKVLKKWAAKLK